MDASNKSFRLFLIIWFGQLFSKIGCGISAFSLGIYLFQQTGSIFTYSSFLLCAFLPSILLTPIGGVIADRVDRKLLMILGDLGSSFGVLFIIVMYFAYPERQWPIYCGILITSISAAMHSPAFKASISDLLDESSYAKASGLVQLAEASRYIVAPILAGYLLLHHSLPVVLAIDLFTFLCSAMAIFLVKCTAEKKHKQTNTTGFMKELTDGFRGIVQSRLLPRLLYLTIVVTFLTGILQVLLVPLILAFSDVRTVGTIQSIAASGMVVSSVLISAFGTSVDQAKTLWFSLSTIGFFCIFIGASTDILFFTASAFCVFFTLPFVNTSLEVLFRQNIANEIQGRVWSLISLISQTGMLLAFGVTGLLADYVFNPLLTDAGILAGTVGKLIGTGATRGSGLLVIIAGILLVISSFSIAKQWCFTKAPVQSLQCL